MHVESSLARAASRLPRWTWLPLAAVALTGVTALAIAQRTHVRTGSFWAQLAALAVALILFGAALRALRLTRSVSLIGMAGLALRVAYRVVSPYNIRTHDCDQHIEYVEYILTHHALPAPSAGWAFYHPPLYFALAAALWRALTALGVTERATIMAALQLQSLAYHLGFLVFSLLAGERWLARAADSRLPDPALRSRMRLLYATLLCVWPSGVMHSVRVGNDDLFYLFCGGVFYFLARWWPDGKDRDFTLAAVFAALAVMAKSNGLVAFALLGILFVVRAYVDAGRSLAALFKWRSLVSLLRRAWPAKLLLIASVGATLARALLDPATRKSHHLLVANADRLTKALAVGNTAANYLWFDVKMFVTQPYSTSWVDDAGRQYFANFALKTSILGDYQFDGVSLASLGEILAALLLAMLATALVGLAQQHKSEWLEDLPWSLGIVLFATSLAALRASIPMACSNDFRYIWPIVTPAILLYVRALGRLRQVDRLGWARAGEGAGWAFAGATLAFFVVLGAQG